MKFYVEEKELTDENTGNPVTYRQVVLEADGIRIPICAIQWCKTEEEAK